MTENEEQKEVEQGTKGGEGGLKEEGEERTDELLDSEQLEDSNGEDCLLDRVSLVRVELKRKRDEPTTQSGRKERRRNGEGSSSSPVPTSPRLQHPQGIRKRGKTCGPGLRRQSYQLLISRAS